MRAALSAGTLALATALTLPLSGQSPVVEIEEWQVPYEESRPRDPYVAPDGTVWFVGQRSHYVASLDPASGEFTRYDLEDGAGPHNLIVDEDGIVWYAGNLKANIGRLDPATREIEIIPMPDPAARDPHTLVFDQAGDIWFTVQGGNFVGKLTTATREVQLIPVPTAEARPYGIKIDAENRPWIVLFGTNKLATVDPGTMALREIDLPRAEARPRRIGLTSDGAVWYVDYAAGFLGRYDPTTGEFEEWATPSGAESQPYGMAVDDQDRIWFVESGPEPNLFVGFDTKTEQYLGSTPVPSGGGTVRHMYYHAPDQVIWFGADTNTVGRATLPTATSS